jgi:hypothetical protein
LAFGGPCQWQCQWRDRRILWVNQVRFTPGGQHGGDAAGPLRSVDPQAIGPTPLG